MRHSTAAAHGQMAGQRESTGALPTGTDTDTDTMDTLLSSTIWPLGSVFLSLFKQTLCTSLPSIATCKPDSTDAELDGSPIVQLPPQRTECHPEGSDSERDSNLEHLLTNSAEPASTTRKRPSLSDRLTSPSSPSGYERHLNRPHPPHQPSSGNKDSERWVQSFHKTTSHSNMNHGHPHHPSPHLANRFDLNPKDFVTSSNRTECDARAWRSWGPKPHSDHHQADYRSNKRSRLPDYTGHSEASSPQRTNDYRNTAFRSLDKTYEDKFQGDPHNKKRKYKINPIDWDWNHWTNAATLQSEQRPSAKKCQSPQLSESVDNCPASGGASVSAIEWKKRAIEVGMEKVKHSSSSHPIPDVHAEHHHKRQKMDFVFDRRDRSIGRHTTRSISPAVSTQAGSNSGRLPTEPERNYYKLEPLHPALKDSIKRAVYSWINQLLVECFWKIGIWFEDSKRWKSDQWGSIRLDQLEELADLQYPKGLNWILRTCKTDRFIDLTIKPIHSGIFVLHKDPQTNADYLKLTKDYTPIGLLYRPIIKTLRRVLTSTGTNRIKIEKFVRQHLLQSSEEELIYLFQNDVDPYGCIKRAARDGILEIFDDSNLPQSFTLSLATRAGFSEQPPPSHSNHKRKRVAFDEKYIGLKAHWLTNKEATDNPSIYSPTISQGGSSGMVQTEEENAKKESSNDMQEGTQADTSMERKEDMNGSKTSSTNTDGSDHLEMTNSTQNHPDKPNRLNQHIVFGKNHNNNPVGSNMSSFAHEDDATIDIIIAQFKKDIVAFY